jgi:hypothetical protein
VLVLSKGGIGIIYVVKREGVVINNPQQKNSEGATPMVVEREQGVGGGVVEKKHAWQRRCV